MEQNIDAFSAIEKRVPGTTFAVAETLNDVTSSYNNRSITYNGSLENLDIDAILRQKQDHINDIYQ